MEKEFNLRDYRQGELEAAKSVTDWLAADGTLTEDADNYALLGWSYAALQRRVEYFMRVPYEWQDEAGNVIEDAELPFAYGVSSEVTGNPADDRVFDTMRVLARELISKDVYGKGALFKHRGVILGANPTMSQSVLMSLAHMNSRFLTAVQSGTSQIGQVPQHYTYGADTGAGTIPTSSLILFQQDGFSEYRPFMSPAQAGELASLLLGKLDEMLIDVAIDPKPILGVEWPASATDTQKKEGAKLIERVMNNVRVIRHRAARWIATPFQKVFNLGQGVTVHQVPKIPDAMRNFQQIGSDKSLEVSSIYGVPYEILTGNSSSYASRSSNEYAFIQTMANEFKAMADALNNDPDIKALGVQLVVLENKIAKPIEETMGRVAMAESFYRIGVETEDALIAAGVDLSMFPDGIRVREMQDSFFQLPAARNHFNTLSSPNAPLTSSSDTLTIYQELLNGSNR